MSEGFSFEWQAGRSPVLTSPTGRRMELEVVQGVPIVYRGAKLAAPVDPEIPDVPGESSSDDDQEQQTDPTGKRDPKDPTSGPKGSADGTLPTGASHGSVPPHHYVTHLPKHAGCDACQKAKMQRRQCRRKRREFSGDEAPSAFGDIITIDHIVTVDPEAASVEGDANALTIRDVATGWVDCFPTVTKSAEDTVHALERMVGRNVAIKRVHTDGADELRLACEELGWPQTVSTPGRPQTNGVVERTSRLVLEGARTLLNQSGLDKRWWSRAVR